MAMEPLPSRYPFFKLGGGRARSSEAGAFALLHDVRRRTAEIPDQAQQREETQNVVRHVDLPSAKALFAELWWRW
jgi:hypothetical protein